MPVMTFRDAIADALRLEDPGVRAIARARLAQLLGVRG